VPEEAIVPQGGRQFVIKLLDGPNEQTRTTRRVEVKVGLRSPGKVEILEGLEPGDTVVATGQQRVQKDGTVVSMVEAARADRPAPEKNGSAASPAVAPAPSAAASDGEKVAVKATPQSALAGPNPCGVVISEAPSMVVPVRSISAPERSPAAPPPVRNPA
jgi:membrane fusion protein (multidrug efflux system)